MNVIVFASCLAVAALGTAAIAAPLTYELPNETAVLKPGAGADTAAVCGACHSVDYITTQPSKKGKAFWDAEVQKMVKVYKAPIEPADAAAIVDYLAATY
jgi:hypothetical protein